MLLYFYCRVLTWLMVIVVSGALIGGAVAMGILLTQPSEEVEYRDAYIYEQAVVAADAAHCSEIGR